MKVAFLTGTFSAFSGIERQVQYQAEDEVRAGNEVSVFCFEADLQPTVNYHVVILGMPGPLVWQRIFRLFYPLLGWVVRKHLRSLHGFQRVIAHQYPMTVLAAAAKRKYGAHYTYFDHGIPPTKVFSSILDKVYIWIFTRLMIPSIRDADQVNSISQYLKMEMQLLTGIESCVVYDRYDQKRFHAGFDGRRIREKWHLGQRPVFIFMGRISPHKNIQFLINAFRLIDPGYNAALVVVGKRTFSSYGRRLDKIATPDIIFAGYIPEEEAALYYAAANVYVTASLWEGYDLPVVEARVCGKPSVMFDIGPHPEIATPNDILVSCGDMQAFSNAMVAQLMRQGFKFEGELTLDGA